MPTLPQTTLEPLIERAVQAGLAGEARRRLIAPLTPTLRAHLPAKTLPADQLRSDLITLNTWTCLPDKVPPVLRWLGQAAHLAKDPADQQAFRAEVEAQGFSAAEVQAAVQPTSVYLCGAHDDRLAIDRLAGRLRARLGVTVVVGEAITHDGEWIPRAAAALADHHAAVLCLNDAHVVPPCSDARLTDAKSHVLPVCLGAATPALPGWLTARTGYRWPAQHEAAWLDALVEGLTVVRRAEAVGANPYRGLAAFEAAHGDVFFGRAADAARLIDFMAQQAQGHHRFIALTGASGAGKSSLVKAALAPKLRESGWRVAVFRASNAPLADLANAVHRALEQEDLTGTLQAALAQAPQALHNKVAQSPAAQSGAARGVLLVLDQAEEVFAERAEAAAAARAMDGDVAAAVAPFDSLLAAIVHAGMAQRGPVTVLCTVRADHLHRFFDHDAELNAAVSRGLYALGPLAADALHRAIARPVHLRGRHIDPALVEQLTTAVRAEPGHLPLLQFVLDRLWTQAQGALDQRTYTALGKIDGAIARHAEQVLTDLKANGQAAAARVVFERLINLGEGAPDTRRRVPLSLVDDALAPVVKVLVDRRLLTTSRAAQGEGYREQIEVAHEALIREWGTLRGWVNAGRDRIRYEREIENAARQWALHGRSVDYLWAGGRLARLEEYWSTPAAKTRSGDERAFVAACQAAQAQRRQVAERRLAQGLEVARRIGLRAQNELRTSRDVPKLRALLLKDMRELIEALDPDREYAGSEELIAVQLGVEAQTLIEAGRLEEAQDRVEQAVALNRRLAEESGAPDAQRQLSVSLNLLGDLARARGDLDAAQRAYAAALAIAHALAQRDPTNTQWQRDLSASHHRLGDLARARGDLDAAQQAYAAALAIRDALAQRDPTNTDWQRDLSVSHNKVGDLARARGDLDAAQRAYAAALATAQALAQRDPTNTDWQRDLSVSHERLQAVAIAQQDFKAARQHLEAAMAISTQLFEQAGRRGEPTRMVIIQHLQGMQLEAQTGDEPAALAHLKAARALLAGIDARGEFVGDAQLAQIRAYLDEQPPTD